MNLLIITLCILIKVAVIIGQKNDDLSSCQILDKHGKDYFCNYYCHYNDTGVQVQKYGHPISVSSGNVQKTESENYNGINKVEITTKTSLQRYSPTSSKPSTTTYNINKEAGGKGGPPSTFSTLKRYSTTSKPFITTYNINKEAGGKGGPPYASSTSSTLKRYSTTSKPSTTTYNINKENKVPPYASFTSSTSSRPSVLSTVFSRYYLPSKSL